MGSQPNILAIQFRKRAVTEEMEQKSIQRVIGSRATLTFVSALDESVVWHQAIDLLHPYQGVILGGSGDFDFDGGRCEDDPAKTMSLSFLERLRPLLEYIFLKDLPTLGICYGHQLIGQFAGVQVLRDCTQEKSGSHQVQIIAKEEPIFAGLSTTFVAHYGHKDVLSAIPEGATLLAKGEEKCHVSVLRYQQNIYTTQFHPEVTYQDMFERVAATPGYLPDGVCVEDIFIADDSSNILLQNFGNLCCQTYTQTIL